MKTEQAIKHFENEIRFCERAPAGNIAHQTVDWVMVMEANRAALAALREKQARENPKTEADKIRSMSDEELAKLFEDGCPDSQRGKFCPPDPCSCLECWVRHLQKPAEEVQHD